MLGFKNGSELVMTAMGGTAGVFFVMATLSSVIKRDLSGLGKWLLVGALVIIVGAIINVFVGSTVGMLVISTLAVGVFSLFMLYDLKRIVDGGETNYISATLALYLTSSTCSRACWPSWASPAATTERGSCSSRKPGLSGLFLRPESSGPARSAFFGGVPVSRNASPWPPSRECQRAAAIMRVSRWL